MKILNNIEVYGLNESIKASKYPMSVNIDHLTNTITKTVNHLATCEKGTGHDQFLTGIVVQFDVTFTNKVWVEAERYHWFDFVSSQSTMHRISQFELEDAYIEYVDGRMIDIMLELQDDYNTNPTTENYKRLLYSNPCGFRLTARITTNYRQLKTMYAQRKNHRLNDEWGAFCKQLEELPCSWFITGMKNEC